MASTFYKFKEVAAQLRMSERWLWGWLHDHPCDELGRPFHRLAGRIKLFSAADVERIYEALPAPASPRKARVRSNAVDAAGGSQTALRRALALIANSKRSKKQIRQRGS
jgi:hypothetical protein